MLEAVLSTLAALVFGSYGFTWSVYLKVNELIHNHLAHLEDRVAKLEKLSDESSD